MPSDLDAIKAKIAGTEAELAAARTAGKSETYLISLQATLAEQQKKENILLAAQSGATGLEAKSFYLKSSFLSSMGLTEKDDQYALYGSVLAGAGVYARLTYKNYLLRAYVKEQDPVLKDIIGGRFPFTEAELRGARQYVERFGKTPRIWFLMYPLSFVAYECVKRGPRFWLWGKQSNN